MLSGAYTMGFVGRAVDLHLNNSYVNAYKFLDSMPDRLTPSEIDNLKTAISNSSEIMSQFTGSENVFTKDDIFSLMTTPPDVNNYIRLNSPQYTKTESGTPGVYTLTQHEMIDSSMKAFENICKSIDGQKGAWYNSLVINRILTEKIDDIVGTAKSLKNFKNLTPEQKEAVIGTIPWASAQVEFNTYEKLFSDPWDVESQGRTTSTRGITDPFVTFKRTIDEKTKKEKLKHIEASTPLVQSQEFIPAPSVLITNVARKSEPGMLPANIVPSHGPKQGKGAKEKFAESAMKKGGLVQAMLSEIIDKYKLSNDSAKQLSSLSISYRDNQGKNKYHLSPIGFITYDELSKYEHVDARKLISNSNEELIKNGVPLDSKDALEFQQLVDQGDEHGVIKKLKLIKAKFEFSKPFMTADLQEGFKEWKLMWEKANPDTQLSEKVIARDFIARTREIPIPGYEDQVGKSVYPKELKFYTDDELKKLSSTELNRLYDLANRYVFLPWVNTAKMISRTYDEIERRSKSSKK